MRFGLRAKFILFMSLVLLAFSGAFTVINIQTRQAELHRQLEEKASALIALLGASAADPLYLLQIEDLKFLLKDVISQDDVLYAYVYDEDGQIVTDGSRANPYRFQRLKDNVSINAVAAQGILIQFGDDILDVAKPIQVNEKKVGGVRIGFSLAQLHADIADVRNRNIMLGLGVTAIGVVLAFVLIVVVTRPLGLLMQGTRAVAGGNLEHEIEVHTKDELNFLASSFNAMTRNLRQAQDALERRVEERTAELEETNATLTKEMIERKRAENDLVRVQRLRVATELSAGVSHNINNLLTGILTPAEIMKEIVKEPRLAKYVDMICTSANRTKDLVHQLHQYTQGIKEDKLRRVMPNMIVKDVVETARPRWQDEMGAKGVVVDVVTKLDHVPPIQGTEAGLHDVVLNLVFNAVDAMPKGGVITIQTEAKGQRVRLRVKDTGMGMDEETRMRVFEPFFTTKATVGTGLGLATVYGTVTGWGGTVTVDSTPGVGTEFVIDLPIWVGTPLQPIVMPERDESRAGKILLVEDNDIVVEMVQDLLAPQHDMDVVVEGGIALQRFAPGEYDVALLDLGLPGMLPGNQIAEQFKAMDPHVVTVLITGWELTENDYRLEPFDFYIQKPLGTPEHLLSVMAQAIELHDQRVKDKQE